IKLEKRVGRSKVEGRAAIASIRPEVEDRVSANVSALLEGGDDSWQEAAAEYAPMMEIIAGSFSPGFTTAALQRRSDIASELPRMGGKSKSVRKEEDR
ncbi:MAG: hypothetical protein NT018_04710, partial [Armatimonadetes bacterium]|nr:hypothetical protein [Armatimonadota bacterium]